jgi:hypothetical protein
MKRGRSALLVLIAGIVLALPAGDGRRAVLTQNERDFQITAQDASWANWVIATCPSRQLTISRYAPWRSRLKSVLEETDENVVDERDLGPADVPDRLIGAVTIELRSCPPSVFPPLRC